MHILNMSLAFCRKFKIFIVWSDVGCDNRETMKVVSLFYYLIIYLFERNMSKNCKAKKS